jgi:hypothetical protein
VASPEVIARTRLMSAGSLGARSLPNTSISCAKSVRCSSPMRYTEPFAPHWREGIFRLQRVGPNDRFVSSPLLARVSA